MEKLSIYFTRTYSSITVSDNASRDTSAKNMPDVIANMQDDDRQLLLRFCQSITECINGNCKWLNEF